MRIYSRLRPPRWSGGTIRRGVAAAAQLPSPPLGAAVSTLLVAVACVVMLVAFLADRSADGARRGRAAGEARSFSEHSAWLATGDAFGGYIQLLRDAEDADVRGIDTASDIRTSALRRLLELNTNRFEALAVVHLNGTVVAASDPSILDAPGSAAFAAVRANMGNANSDIVITEAGANVDYASILVADSGEPWGVLVARALPDHLWQSTLAATVDGGRNIVINSAGQVAAGVPAAEIGEVWRGREWTNGTIRASHGGVDSVCALEAIARDTQIDHGWVVASCLPTATVLAGSGGAFGGVTLLGLVAAVLATALGAGALWLGGRYAGVRVVRAEAPLVAPEETAADEPEEMEHEDAAPVGLPPQTIEARTVIEAYESRSARLASQIRESVQARLLVASSRIEEALTLTEDDPALARVMLERAAHELDDVNERELRAMGQDLYPDLVRLGLPAALRSLRKDVADVLEVEIDAEADADSLDEDSERAISAETRTVLYRLVLDAVEAAAEASLEACTVMLRRPSGGLWLCVKAHGPAPEIDGGRFEIDRLAVEAYGGVLSLDVTAESFEVVAEFAGAESRKPSEPDEPETEPEPGSEPELEPGEGGDPDSEADAA